MSNERLSIEEQVKIIQKVLNKNRYAEDHVLEFGIYQGEKLIDVAETNPKYLEWLLTQKISPQLKNKIKVVVCSYV